MVGAIYTHPVGYRAGGRPPLRALPRRALTAMAVRRAGSGFIFASGIECSYPTIEHGRWRRDEMASTGITAVAARTFELATAVGVTHLRYGRRCT